MDNVIALVTGGTGGIGTAICRALAKDGYLVAAAYNTIGKGEKWQAEQKAQGYNFFVVHMNVANYESCIDGIKKVESNLGPISVLVNNAGITKDVQLRKMTPEQWHQVISTNLDSIFNVTQPLISGMVERGFGRVINIASINGQKGQFGQCNYAAAKAGIHGFTKSLAQEVARKGVTVNTLSPGYIATDMVMVLEEKVRAKIIEQIPVHRLGTPEDIARCVTFLANKENGFITGADLAVNGGQHMY